jgi:hypothetical protein
VSDGLGAGGWAKRLVVLVVVAGLVVAAVAGVAAVADTDDGGGTETEPMAVPEYQPENVSVDYRRARGDVRPDRSETTGSGTVVVDAGHGNRFDRATLEPLVRGLTRVGYDVEYYRSGDLAAALEDAKAFVVVDPSQEYRPGDVDDVRRFTGQGGHLLVVGEPDRVRVSGGLFGTSLTTQESSLTALGSAYGASVGTAYLYNQERADANYKWVEARATDADGLDDVNETTVYTAGAVRMRGGEPLLRAAPGTRQSSTADQTGRYPVAARRSNVVVLGDKTFMRADRYRVADNEAFVEFLVEFLANSDRAPGQDVGGTVPPEPPGNDTVTGADSVDVD